MVVIEWTYSAYQESPYIELGCTEADLAEAKEKLSKHGYMCWVQYLASGVSHTIAFEWAKEEENSERK